MEITTMDIIVITSLTTILVALAIWEIVESYQAHQARKQEERYHRFVKYRRKPLILDKTDLDNIRQYMENHNKYSA